MSAIPHQPVASSRDAIGVMLRVAVVSLTLATAYIHAILGGALFMANAIGYVVLAAAMAAPIAIASRHRWLARAALLGFTLATIGAWLVFGGRFELAYVDKAIELGLVVALLIEMFRYDGGPLGVLRRFITLVRGIL